MTVDDEQAVGALGQLAAHAQVTHHGFDRDVGAHRDGIEVHETAGAVLLEAQHGGEAGAILRVHGVQHALVEGFGQVADQVGQVVDLHALGRGDQLLCVHAADQLGAHFLVELDQHVAFDLGVDELPDDLALGRRQRLDQRGDLRRVHRVDHALTVAHGTLLECAAQRRESAGLGCRSFGHRRSLRQVNGAQCTEEGRLR